MSVSPQNPYLRAAIDGEVANLACAVEGSRNRTLFKCAASLASLGLREGEILQHLKPIADTIGLRGRELYATVKSGLKAGNSRPRAIPDNADEGRGITKWAACAPICQMEDQTVDRRSNVFFIAKSDGPAVSSDELRRHVYRPDGRPVRMKIKRGSGYANWYRVTRDGQDGWQAAKPEAYVACPYIGQ